MRSKTLCGLLLCVTLAFCLALPPSATAASAEEEVLQVITNWDKAMNTADFDLMSSLYWHSAKMSEFAPAEGFPFLYQGWEALETWWKNYLGLPAGTFISTRHNIQVTILLDNVAIVTSYQNLVVNPPVMKEQTIIQGRNTTVVQKIRGKWLIVHGHGSVFPVE